MSDLYETKPVKKEGYVYFIRGEFTPLVKIGHAWNVKKRLGELRPYSPNPLLLLGSIFHVDRCWLEGRLHKVYSDRCDHHEWFQITDYEVGRLLSGLGACRNHGMIERLRIEIDNEMLEVLAL